MNTFQWDSKGFTLNGQPGYPVSGEFHYFRVPAEDWTRRMQLLKEAGGNCIATYVPWNIHEMDEGNIVFGDVPNRDLAKFLETAKAEGLMVILRPGPYQYSELTNDGLPDWLVENYPELLARNAQGESFRESSISYLHPTFLEKARRYFRAYAEVARPYMAENGGPVVMTQLDNEVMGIHLWFGSMDYNAETMGFGQEDGRYPRWLRARYESVEAMNAAYGTSFDSFTEVQPPENPSGSSAEERRRMRDYASFYLTTIGEYLELLRDWLREDGITGPICHNSGNATMNGLFAGMIDRLGDDFLLGSDHYYNLGPSWAQNNPTPQYMLRMLVSCELLRAQGMPPTAFELPAGNLADTPPILAEDLLACYKINTAMGMKGLNYYVFTGGPNFRGTGKDNVIYDYHAPVSADGSLKDTYPALKEFGLFLKDNGWMQRAGRVSSVQVGFTWEMTRFQEYAPSAGLLSPWEAWHLTEMSALYSLMSGSYAPELVPVTGKLDPAKPLVMVCPSCMSREAQQSVIRFIEEGGQALLMPVLPEYDEDGRPCTLLRDFVGLSNLRAVSHPKNYIRVDGAEDVYLVQKVLAADLPDDAQPLAWDDRSDSVVGAQLSRGKGKLIWLGLQFPYQMFCQAAMLEALLRRLGAKPTVESSNRNVFTALWSDGERRMLYVLNPYSGAQSSCIRVREGEDWCDLGEIRLRNMEIRTIEL